jgi:hypothetical protein
MREGARIAKSLKKMGGGQDGTRKRKRERGDEFAMTVGLMMGIDDEESAWFDVFTSRQETPALD